ncbi:hypothetical protein K2X05_05430 [bacterium]|nr:hypothetical protein [bacterium]
MSYVLALILNFSFHSNAQYLCKDIFIDKSWVQTKNQIEDLNSSGLLFDMVLVQNSDLTSAVRSRSISEVFRASTKAKLQRTQNIFFDEISLAIALKANFAAQFLYHSSNYNYKKVLLGQDLLLVAIYFKNTKMFDFFMHQGLHLSDANRRKVLNWALETNRPDVHWAMTQLSR